MFNINFNTTVFVTSLILIIEGISFFFCIPFALYYHEPLTPFLLPGLFTIAFGLLFFIFSYKTINRINDNYQVIALLFYSWMLLIILGTFPYLIDKSVPSYINMLFEVVSGFTTTGTTILTNIENLPKSILFWRSITHWLGGFGAIITAIFILPKLNFGGNKLFSFNSYSNTHTGYKFRNIISSVILIYFILTFAQTLFLYSGGMDFFESICYSFGTVSTGSFTLANKGLAGYSPYIHYTMILFMFLSGISYIFYYFIITGKFRIAFINEEVKLFVLTIFLITLLISGILYFKLFKGIEPAFREGLFQVISFITTSGYSITNYLLWPSYTLLILVFFLFTGGCTSSASGGIKMSRFLILFRNLKMTFKMFVSQLTDYKIKYNNKNLNENSNLSVITYITVFGIAFMLGTMALSLLKISFKESVFLSISALSTFGYNHSLAGLPEAGKIILIFLMILGRIEIYTFLLLLTPSCNRKY
ncbi:MAG: hypothetical protein A2X13_02280 [Bacteroidetes bacterium GWC2_33_15]|nr:MAG: hypothetical protein A2X10_07345 [Bacteroidetes bacterium GWA2_33_15]OFX52301.1 MAG: hypothetical protein A2X13_02280 [Bacteroidetes bacterium GWC2_33_15]OFX64455.1 MAG: hypothetical protein A2X15_13100 [Bacteroidetes bacterium GWB2_32_14]OFX67860.1 MAG: hypothetical protein A2X14_06925 [Bacteroidetes bacterium GWD2_33_33]HAN19479.1 hypothetical protein [Bacteroidales bacterium]